MKIEFLRNKKSEEVKRLIEGFSHRYVADLNNFALTIEQYSFTSPQAANHLNKLLRKWRGCRPKSARKDRLPLLKLLDKDFKSISQIDLRNFRHISPFERITISRIWSELQNQICDVKKSTAVAPSKAMLILTNGRLGPALDSNVRKSLKLPKVLSPDDYISLLNAISEDIAVFEQVNAPVILEDLVPIEWQPVFVGRAYDMAIGPRDKNIL
jgi:hypothetical protein